MDKAELIAVLNAMRSVRNAANWAGMFTHAIRDATREHRYTKIAAPLDEAIAKLEKELAKRERNAKRTRRSPAAYRTPYVD